MTKKGTAISKSRLKDDQFKVYEVICRIFCESYNDALKQISFVNSMFIR